MSSGLLSPARGHSLGRLSLCLTLQDRELALTLRSRAESMAAHLMPRVIERVFDRLAPPGRVVQLERLSLDLGTLAADSLEADVAAALERTLEAALSEALRGLLPDEGPATAVDRGAPASLTPDMALLRGVQAYLLRGVVPFRSTGDAFDLASDVAQLLATQPLALKRGLRALVSDSHALKRLAAQLDVAGLQVLLSAMAPTVGAASATGDVHADARDDSVGSKPGWSSQLQQMLSTLESVLAAEAAEGEVFSASRNVASSAGPPSASPDAMPGQSVPDQPSWATADQVPAQLHAGLPDAIGFVRGPGPAAHASALADMLAHLLERPGTGMGMASLQLLNWLTPGELLSDCTLHLQTAEVAWAAALSGQGASPAIWAHWLGAFLHRHRLAAQAESAVLGEPMQPPSAAMVGQAGPDKAWRKDVLPHQTHLTAFESQPLATAGTSAAGMPWQHLAPQQARSAPSMHGSEPRAWVHRAEPRPSGAVPAGVAEALTWPRGFEGASAADAIAMAPQLRSQGLSPTDILLALASHAVRQPPSLALRELARSGATPSGVRPVGGRAVVHMRPGAAALRSRAAALQVLALAWLGLHPAALARRELPRALLAEVGRARRATLRVRAVAAASRRPSAPGPQAGAPGADARLDARSATRLLLRRVHQPLARRLASDLARPRSAGTASLALGRARPATPWVRSGPLQERQRLAQWGAKHPASSAAPWLGALQDFLTTGEHALAGVYLRTGLRDDAPALAALLRRVAAASPTAAQAVALRVLEWLTPLDVLTLLVPEVWGNALAAPEAVSPGRVVQPDWPQWVQAALHGDSSPPPWTDAPVAHRVDSLAALAHWLDHGQLPRWAPPTLSVGLLLPELPRRPWVDLWLLFASGSMDGLRRRLTRAVRALGAGLASELLSRLAPALPPSPASSPLQAEAAPPAPYMALPAQALDAAWGAWLQAALTSASAEPLPTDDQAARAPDAAALLSHWLEHGVLPAWAPAQANATDLLYGLAQWPQAERLACLAAGGREACQAGLQRAVQWLGPDEGPRWLAQCAPTLWAAEGQGPSSATPRVTAALATGALANDVARAAARAPVPAASEAIPPAATMHPRGASSHPEPPAAPAAQLQAAGADRLHALHWLKGQADVVALDARMARVLAELLDEGDTEVDAGLHSAASQPAQAERWAASLPDEVLGRLLHRLAPSDSEPLRTAMIVLTAAASPVEPTPTPAAPAYLPWAALLPLVSARQRPDPGSDSTRRVVQALASAMTNGHAAQAAQLMRQARQLAHGTVHFDVLALFQPMAPAASQPPRQQLMARPQRKMPLPEPGQTVYLGNAGLVLIGPYLPMFFERLGLLTPGDDGKTRVRGMQAATRAVHLLQYLVDGHTDRPEPDLVLNKLLAGLLPADVVLPRYEPEPSDLETCDSLLQAVIANWTIIRTSSTAALRETFLQREGRLVREPDRWALQVQRKAVDVLVDQLPWGFSVAYHRWMADPIHVTW